MKKGKIIEIKDFYMKNLDRKRDLRIYLPIDYETSNKSYPVLYMHDAQNIFDAESSAFGMAWHINEYLDKIKKEELYNGMIVVGINNGSEVNGLGRYNEYSPWKVKKDIKNKMSALQDLDFYIGGEGFEYIDFVADDLKAFIDNKYRTLSDRGNTAVAGSSMGGFISLVAGLKREDIFSKVFSFSSASFFAQEEFLKFIKKTQRKKELKIYMDIGTKETSNEKLEEFPEIYLNTNKEVYNLLKENKLNKIKFVIDEGAKHNENAWNKRLPEAFEWIFLG